MKDRFSKGNRKLSKNILIWNLPRKLTCPGADACLDWCYEIKIERMYRNVRVFRVTNYNISQKTGFAVITASYLRDAKEPYIRIHESGDFYNQKYLDAWKSIAKNCPNKNFYAYTKSLHLDLWTNLPPNFNILQSYGGKFDKKIDLSHPTFRAVPKEQTPMAIEYVCPSNASTGGCGTKCTKCITDKYAHVAGVLH